MLEGGGTQLLVGNGRWVGPGGASVLQQPEGDIIVYHAYGAKTGDAWPQISTLSWKVDGRMRRSRETPVPATDLGWHT